MNNKDEDIGDFEFVEISPVPQDIIPSEVELQDMSSQTIDDENIPPLELNEDTDTPNLDLLKRKMVINKCRFWESSQLENHINSKYTSSAPDSSFVADHKPTLKEQLLYSVYKKFPTKEEKREEELRHKPESCEKIKVDSQDLSPGSDW